MSEDLPNNHYKEHPHSIWSFYRHGFGKAIKESLEKYGWAILLLGLVYTVIALFVSSKFREEKFGGFDINFWLTYIFPAILLVFFFGYHIIRAPYEIYLEQWKHAELERNAHKLEIESLASELEDIKEQKCPLAIESIICERSIGYQHFCRIKIKNQSKGTSAVGVKVELVAMLPHPVMSRASKYELPIAFPIRLNPQYEVASNWRTENWVNHVT
jgi:hypothetical protein